MLTYEQGVEAFRVTDRLSRSERAALMGDTLQQIYNWPASQQADGLLASPALPDRKQQGVSLREAPAFPWTLVRGKAFVVTAERFREVETRLKSHGIDYIGPIVQLRGLLGIYFYDPNGIRLEFACPPEDGEAPAVIPCVIQTKAEARDELATLTGVMPEWIEMRLAALPV